MPSCLAICDGPMPSALSCGIWAEQSTPDNPCRRSSRSLPAVAPATEQPIDTGKTVCVISITNPTCPLDQLGLISTQYVVDRLTANCLSGTAFAAFSLPEFQCSARECQRRASNHFSWAAFSVWNATRPRLVESCRSRQRVTTKRPAGVVASIPPSPQRRPHSHLRIATTVASPR